MNLPLEALRSVKTIYSHRNCADGVASALILADALPNAEVKFLDRDSSVHKALVPHEGVLFVDFVPYVERYTDGDKKGQMTRRGVEQAQAWVEAGAIVLDHHEGTADLAAMFGDRGVYENAPGVSGAVLAYREVWAHIEPRGVVLGPTPGSGPGLRASIDICKFSHNAGVYDTWQKNDLAFKEARAQAEALIFWPAEQLLKEDLLWVISNRLEIGETLLTKNAERDARTIAEAYRFTVGPFANVGPYSGKTLRVVCFEGTHVNDIADALLYAGLDNYRDAEDRVDLVMGWHVSYEDASYVKMSCRSRGDFDCMSFAQHLGGNGQTARAAGFRSGLPLNENLHQYCKYTVCEHLRSFAQPH